jgi:hypothetical protein
MTTKPPTKPSERAMKCAKEIRGTFLVDFVDEKAGAPTNSDLARIIDHHNAALLHTLTVAELVIGEFLYDENRNCREDNARSVIKTIRELKGQNERE